MPVIVCAGRALGQSWIRRLPRCAALVLLRSTALGCSELESIFGNQCLSLCFLTPSGCGSYCTPFIPLGSPDSGQKTCSHIWKLMFWLCWILPSGPQMIFPYHGGEHLMDTTMIGKKKRPLNASHSLDFILLSSFFSFLCFPSPVLKKTWLGWRSLQRSEAQPYTSNWDLISQAS